VRTEAPAVTFEVPRRDRADVVRGMVAVPGGSFLMGADDPDSFPDDGEGPVRAVTVAPFHIDAKTVTNTGFAAFVKATGYRTEAERFGWSYVFQLFVRGPAAARVLDAHVPGAPWWLPVEGADWRHPEPGSDLARRDNHPVVHVSWHDGNTAA
jgi:formylglycine-generating enzyme required for sulfatase activity